jgi:hypothetical protein
VGSSVVGSGERATGSIKGRDGLENGREADDLVGGGEKKTGAGAGAAASAAGDDMGWGTARGTVKGIINSFF